MKSLFVIVSTPDQDRRIIYTNEDQFNLDQVFNIREGENSDVITYKEKIALFFHQYIHFGLIQKNHFLGLSGNFIIDFFSQERKVQCHELLIEETIYYMQYIKNKNYVTLVLALPKDLTINSQYVQYCLQFITKCLIKLEKNENKLSNIINKIIFNTTLFEKEVNEMIPDFEKKKYKSNQVRDDIIQIAKKYLDQCELRKNLNSFYQQLVINRKQEFTFFNITLKAPPPENFISPSNIKIKPYQTLLIPNLRKDDKKNEAHESFRINAFFKDISPSKSFQEISYTFNFNMNEIEVYVNHALSSIQGSQLLNKITDYTYFVITQNQPMSKFHQKFQTMKDWINIFDKPIQQKEFKIIEQQMNFDEQFKLSRNLYYLIGFKLIRQCEVYLYQKNPLLNRNEIEQILLQLKKPYGIDRFSYIQWFDLIQPYLNQQFIVEEIAYRIGYEIVRFWQVLENCVQIIGIYCM